MTATLSDRPCFRCGKNPAEGFASVWTAATGERWYCHGDDDDPSCYEAATTLVGLGAIAKWEES